MDIAQALAVRNTDIIHGDIGVSATGMAITDTLHVSPDGVRVDGESFLTGYQTIQSALDAASTDADDCTLILVSPHATFYDIYTTGDPTWTGNYEIVGTHRIWAPIRNSHGSATSIMNFSGKVSLRDLAIFQIGTVNGVGFTNSGFRIRQCGFNSEGLTGAATAIYVDGSAAITRGGVIDDIQILGHVTHTKGLRINTSKINEFKHIHIHKCLTGIQQEGATSDYNTFEGLDIGDCALGIDIDAGNEPLFNGVLFHHNTVNVDDEVGDAFWNDVKGELDVTLEPDNFTGVAVATHANADTWTTTPVEIRAAASSTVPFKIVATLAEGDATEKFRIRFSADSGATWFDDISIEGVANAQKRESSAAPTATDHMFNKGTQIVAASKSESGANSVVVWIEIQEI